MAACASQSSGVSTVQGTPQPTSDAQRLRELIWPIKTRENVDLWLHGFALLEPDSTAKIPLFIRGYRDDMVVDKNKANILTQLDVNVEKLQAGLRANPRLADAQFAALYFASIDEMRAAIDMYVGSNADPRAANTPQAQMAFSVLASYFPSPGDRAWLSLFASGLWDESTKYYHSYWMQRQRAGGTAIDSTQSLWQSLMRPRIQRFLNGTQQANGSIILSIPVGGEGRTLSTGGSKNEMIAVPFPQRPSDAAQPLYVVAHEVVGSIVNHVVADNVSPNQERAGVGDRLRAVGTVRAGLILLEKNVPELADGYARYYITQAGEKVGANPRSQLATLFPLPTGMADELAKQVESVQSGI